MADDLCVMCAGDRHPGNLTRHPHCTCSCRGWNIGFPGGISKASVTEQPPTSGWTFSLGPDDEEGVPVDGVLGMMQEFGPLGPTPYFRLVIGRLGDVSPALVLKHARIEPPHALQLLAFAEAWNRQMLEVAP